MNPGAERIRRFSTFVWMLGTIAVASVAFAVFPRIFVDPQTGDVYVGTDGEQRAWPWFAEEPREYEIVDGVIHGTRDGGYLRLDGGDDLIMLTTDGEFSADWVPVYQQLSTQLDTEADDWEPGGFVGSLYPEDEVVIMPGDADGLLWFGESLSDWTAVVTTPQTIDIDETYSGQGNAVLLYDGDALSGRFAHTGSGIFIVAAVTVGDWQLLVNEADDVDLRASWAPTDRVALFVESDTGDGTWTITLDTPAGAPPGATPSPTTTQGPR